MQLLILKYPDNLMQYYQKFIHLPGFVLLQSTDRNKGRYDIISAHPYDSFKISDYSSTSLQEWQQFSELLCQQDSQIDLPFQGGAIGYIAYDFGARVAGINSIPQQSLADMPLVDLNLYDWALIIDHVLKKVTLFAGNKHPATIKIIPEIVSLWEQENLPHDETILTSNFSPLMTKEQYYRGFDSIMQALKAGRSYQVNFTQAFHAQFEGDSWNAYKKIAATNPVPYAAFMRTQQTDILSFSPERFLKYEHGVLCTSPIKGTIKSSPNAKEDKLLQQQLNSCTKNRAENTMIVDLLRNDLGKIAKPGSIKVTNLCKIHSFNGLHHLISDIQAQALDAINPLNAFLSCFPGGSITGAPKLESMRIIHELEAHARGVYCGSIGYFSNHRRFDTNIAIRTIIAKDSLLHLAAGGGIVIDSNVEDEYRETYTKIAGIINGLK